MEPKKQEWKRPESVPVPTVWRRCTGLKKLENGTTPKFVIQDIPVDMHEDIIQFMMVHYMSDEMMAQSLNLIEDQASVKDFQDLWRKVLEQNLGLVAFDESNKEGDKPKIAGCNITGVSLKTDKFTTDMGKGIKTLIKACMEHAMEVVDVYEHYGVDEYMTAMGLCVHRDYRGQGIGLEILKARFDLGKAVGLKATITIFSGYASQKLAHTVGFEVLTEVNYDYYKDDEGEPAFPNIKCKSLKIMGKRIE